MSIIRLVKTKIFFIITGIIPILLVLFKTAKPDPLLAYSLYSLAYLLRNPLEKIIRAIFLGVKIKFFLLFLFFGLTLEFLAWLGNFVQKNPQPALLHTQLFPDLIIATGLYGGLALGWILAFKYFKFSLKQFFIIQGLFGVLIEQQGAIFIQGLLAFPLGILFWTYVFIAYSAPLAVSFMLTEKDLTQSEKDRWYKYPLTLIILGIISTTGIFVWSLLIEALRILPPQKFIADFPLW